MIIGLTLTAIAFSQMVKLTDGDLLATFSYPSTWTGLMIGSLVLFTAGYATSIGTIPWHSAEFIPLEIRGFVSSAATATK